MKTVLSPSVMCSDTDNLFEEIIALDAAGADTFHLDIMDGIFVPNYALNWQDVATVRLATDKPIEMHLMVNDPALHLPYAFASKAETIYIHYESINARSYLHTIRNHGSLAGLAVNPETEVYEFAPLLPIVDRLLIMRVNPGFKGRPAEPGVDPKIAQLSRINMRRFKLILDGAVSKETIAKWTQRGVDGFVLGTASGMFGPRRSGRPYDEIMRDLRMAEQRIGTTLTKEYSI